MSRVKHVVLFCLMASLCMALLTGCPSRHTKEEEDAILSTGIEKLTQALEGHYGLKEGDWQIVSQKIFWGSAYGFNAVSYSLKAGDRDFTATVHTDDSGEVYTDYYGKEFEEALVVYLNEKMEEIPEYQQETLKLFSVKFSQELAGNATEGMIPASVSPEDFSMYLEKCEQDWLMNVQLTLTWFSEDPKQISDELQGLITQGLDGPKKTYLTVKRFACDANEKPDPMDLREDYAYLPWDDPKHSVTTYEYFELDENLILQGSYVGDLTLTPEENGRFWATVNTEGTLRVFPDDSYYMFVKYGVEGMEISYKNKDPEYVSTVKLEKDPYFEDWCRVFIPRDSNVMIGDLLQKYTQK